MSDLVDELITAWAREEPSLDASAMALAGRIIRIAGEMEAGAAAALKPLGLAYTDFDILATIKRAGPPYALTPTQLRRSVLLSSGAMTAAIDRLERADLITRRPSPEDRRSQLVGLTEGGKALAAKAAAARFAEAQTWAAKLDEAETARLVALLRKLSA